MTLSTLKEKLIELKGEIKNQDELNAIRIDNILDLLESEDISEDLICSLKSIVPFEKALNAPSSVLKNYSGPIQLLLDELREKVKLKKEEEQNYVRTLSTSAICQMRVKSKGRIFAVILGLGILAGVAILLGILAATNVIGEWGDVCVDLIGVFDCVAGLIFFAYEFYNDKVNEGKINDGDFETVKKYLSEEDIMDIFRSTVKTGDIIGSTGVNVTGKVSGSIINISSDEDEIIKKTVTMYEKYHSKTQTN